MVFNRNIPSSIYHSDFHMEGSWVVVIGGWLDLYLVSKALLSLVGVGEKCSQLQAMQRVSCKVPRPILSGECRHPPPLQPEMLHSWCLRRTCYCHSLVCAWWGKPTTRPILLGYYFYVQWKHIIISYSNKMLSFHEKPMGMVMYSIHATVKTEVLL